MSATTVLVTGATGRLGRALLPRLAADGIDVRALSRREHAPAAGLTWTTGDLTTGTGLDAALDGADAVVHLASAPYRRGYTRAVEIDGTARLLASARRAGVTHLAYTSIVGCDRIGWGYFRTKADAERRIADADVPWTVLRAGQFHPFVDAAFGALARTGALVADRGVSAQPVDVADVAARLAALLRRGPSGRVEEFAGPQVLDLRTAVRQWLAATGKRRAVVPVRVPGAMGRAFRAGHLTTDAEPRGTRTWADYLAATYR